MAESKIVAALCAIMAEVGSVEKRGRNSFHGYDYATAADVAHALQQLMAKHGIIIIQTEAGTSIGVGADRGALIRQTYRFFLLHQDGEILAKIDDVPFVHTGAAQSANSKGGLDDKALNKCHTAARKYFLLALFQIPTGEFADEPDSAEDRGQAPNTPPKRAGKPPSPVAPRPGPDDRGEDPSAGQAPSDPPQHVDEWILRWPVDATGQALTRPFRRTEKGGTELLDHLRAAVRVNSGMMDIEENQLLVSYLEERAAGDDKLAKRWVPVIHEIRDLWLNPPGRERLS